MPANARLKVSLFTLLLVSLSLTPLSCVEQTLVDGVFGQNAFTEGLIQARTFIDGTSVTTVTYADAGDGLGRRAFGIDLNYDGRIDPVVGYGEDQAVIQILLSQDDPTTPFVSLTLDSKRDMEDLSDVAVGDIDGDNRLDIVAATKDGVWYFRHPSQGPTYLRGWGNSDESDDLRERIDVSSVVIDDAALLAIIDQALGVNINLEDYIVTVESVYTNVEIGDFDLDGWNDIVASRLLHIHLEPRPDIPVEPIDIFDGDAIVFLNPGGAIDGRDWASVSAGQHERQQRRDRDGAAGLYAFDMDGDGDLDVVSAAQFDNNVQVAWFENPLDGASRLSPDLPWRQWRIGSVRDAWAIDVADVTGDGLLDVIASGTEQQQVMLFVQPDTGPRREYDWDTHVVATFDAYKPKDLQALDIDLDGVNEIVVGATDGAVRYFERPAALTDEWTPVVVITYDPPGDVGHLGYGDIDADGDIDLVVVLSSTEENNSRITWIRNELR